MEDKPFKETFVEMGVKSWAEDAVGFVSNLLPPAEGILTWSLFLFVDLNFGLFLSSLLARTEDSVVIRQNWKI